MVSLGIKAEYSKVKTETHTFEQGLQLLVGPESYGYLCAATPINHFVGNLVVSAGNTTWTMPNVVVDTPNADGNPLYATYDTKTEYPTVPDPCDDLRSGKIKALQTSGK